MKMPEGWTKSADGSCTLVLGEAVHVDKSVKPLVLVVKKGKIVWPDFNGVTSYSIEKGRYKDVLACFVHAQDVDVARDLFTASNALRSWDSKRILESPELEFQAIQKALRLDLLDYEGIWYQIKYELVHAYRAAMTHAQWEALLWYVLAEGCWDGYEWGEKPQVGDGEPVEDFMPLVIAMLKAAYPHAAEALELFRVQIVEAMPAFELNQCAARDYVRGLVAPKNVELFELPELGD